MVDFLVFTDNSRTGIFEEMGGSIQFIWVLGGYV